MPPAYPWYRIVDPHEDLEQGDLFDSFPIILVPQEGFDSPGKLRKVEYERFDIIVMTQSCDFWKMSDDDEVVLCYRISYPLMARERHDLAGKDGWSLLRKGQYTGLQLISGSILEGHDFPHQIVDLARIFTSPLRVVRKFAESYGPRVRLCPPYREHLSQAFARQYMRVGLPVDLPEEFPYGKLNSA